MISRWIKLLLLYCFITILAGCEEDEKQTLVEDEKQTLVETLEYSDLQAYHCQLSARYYIPTSFTSNPELGYCMSADNEEPTISDYRVTFGIGYNKTIWEKGETISAKPTTAFIPNRTYYYRAFMKYGYDVYYGEVLSFTPPQANFSQGNFHDQRTGKNYRTISVDGQTLINDDVILNESIKYTFQEAIDSAPAGWHVPSADEVRRLIASVGPSAEEASAPFDHIDLVNTPIIDGRFPESKMYWTSTPISENSINIFWVTRGSPGVVVGRYGGGDVPPSVKLQVRYFKDE
ncbi:MAG: hypothetical protein QM762_24225 [Chryseolinea sp.]